MTHPHQKKHKNKRARRRAARLAWKNYAALNSYGVLFSQNSVQLLRKGKYWNERTTGMSVFLHPIKLIENPKLACWVVDVKKAYIPDR
jgi:hypothetical protein